MRKLWKAGFAMLMAGSVSAQDAGVPNNTAFGDWIVTCEAVSTERTACRVNQTQTRTDTGALVLQLIGYPQPEGGAVLVAQVPIGVYLPGGLVYRARAPEDAPQNAMIWQRCLGQICEAAVPLDAAALAAMTESGQVLFGYQPGPGAEAIIVAVNTGTLTEALDAVRN